VAKERNPRDVDVFEIVKVLEDYLDYGQAPREINQRAEDIISKLVGPERESQARWSSRHIVADRRYCARLANSLAISEEEAVDYFLGEPVKRIEKVAAWALDAADKNFIGLDKNYQPDRESPGVMVHAQRGRAVANMLRDWARVNQTGIYRQHQLYPQATPISSLEEVL
jgi:hypothetical protein